MKSLSTNANRSARRVRGFSIIEALVAALVLAVGMLALAALQSALVKASAGSKTQSAALALGMQTLEQFRAYRNETQWLNDIIDIDTPVATSISVGGQTFSFTRGVEVRRFRWTPPTPTAAGYFAERTDGTESVAMIGEPEFKQAEVTIAWTTEDNETRSVRLSDVYSSIMPRDSGTLVARPSSARRDPPVRIYTPSEPGIIPIAIGDDQASASSNPKPVQFDTDGGATLTRFNVQTYLNDGGANPLLQRRIEFSLAACQCRAVNTVSSKTNPLYEPTVWTGDRYSTPRVLEGRPMATAIQQINDNQDDNRFDDLCTACCRDHQDAANSVAARTSADADPVTARPYKVAPFRPFSEYIDTTTGNGPLKRYINTTPTNFQSPTLTQVTGASDVWFETCRLVRVDGINRVATDARLENFTVLNMDPTSRTTADSTAAFLATNVVAKYGEFAKKYVEQALGIDSASSPPDATLNLPNTYPVGGLRNALFDSPGPPPVYSALANTYDQTELARAFLDLNGDDTVQLQKDRYHNLHARGLYIDFLSTETKNALACVGSTERLCRPFRNRNPLELVPFFAVNLTNLTQWRRPDDLPTGQTTPPAKLSVSPNGFPQTYGENFIRGRIQAILVGNELIRGSSRLDNDGLTDQIPTYVTSRNTVLNEPEPFSVVGNSNEQTYRYRVRITCPTCVANDPFFTKMGQKQASSSPDGAFCSDTSDLAIRECSVGADPNLTSVAIRFAKYVLPVCFSSGANKGTLNTTTGNCEKNGAVVPTSYTLNYKFCGFTNSPATYAVTSAGTPNGVWGEVASANFSGTNLGVVLSVSLPSSTPTTGPIVAVFVREGPDVYDTCPI